MNLNDALMEFRCELKKHYPAVETPVHSIHVDAKLFDSVLREFEAKGVQVDNLESLRFQGIRIENFNTIRELREKVSLLEYKLQRSENFKDEIIGVVAPHIGHRGSNCRGGGQ